MSSCVGGVWWNGCEGVEFFVEAMCFLWDSLWASNGLLVAINTSLRMRVLEVQDGVVVDVIRPLPSSPAFGPSLPAQFPVH